MTTIKNISDAAVKIQTATELGRGSYSVVQPGESVEVADDIARFHNGQRRMVEKGLLEFTDGAPPASERPWMD